MANDAYPLPNGCGSGFFFLLVPKDAINNRLTSNVGEGIDSLHVYEGIRNTLICGIVPQYSFAFSQEVPGQNSRQQDNWRSPNSELLRAWVDDVNLTRVPTRLKSRKGNAEADRHRF
jgi:hypothetical protein